MSDRAGWGFGRVAGRGILGLAFVVVLAGVPARAELPIEQEPINYLSAKVTDRVARLQQRIDRGEVVLEYDDERGYLKSLLDYLEISPTSQALVFSKTSFQHTRIAPRTPRALYFNDDTYVGYVKGGDVLEIAATDPQLGTVFYLLDREKADRPAFRRETHSCLQCHHSSKTQEVPGLVVRSVYPSRVGTPVFSAGSFVTSHESPLSERWGGWYVTGTHGDQRHMGNVLLEGSQDPERLDREAGANVTDLRPLVDTWPYLTPHSDIVALMVLEHQTQVQNLITRAHYEAKIALRQEAEINKALGRPADAISSTTRGRIASHAEKLVRGLLFAGEAPLTAPIAGTSGFAEQFASRGPRDRLGRSLRDFDLRRRMFRYPCSYLIFSEAFDALPEAVKGQVYRRLREVLTGQDDTPTFAHLSADDRRAILEILAETRPGLPDDWSTGPAHVGSARPASGD